MQERRDAFGLVAVVFVFLAALSMQSHVYAAEIHGSLYDWQSFDKIKNAIVEINTTPEQRFVAVNGDYYFYVPEGSYAIVARYYKNNLLELYGRENIEVTSEGDFILDIILFPPAFEENLADEEILNLTEEAGKIGIEENLFSGLELEKSGQSQRAGIDFYRLFFMIVPIIILAMLLALFYSLRIQRKAEERLRKEEIAESFEAIDSELKKVIEILNNAGGRATQKEIRLKLNCSDAKLSLMLAELEDMGIIRKIKKGRGNIIILRRENEKEK